MVFGEHRRDRDDPPALGAQPGAELDRPDVEVVTDPIERLAPEGIVARGRTHAVDCIIYGTGFRTTAFMFPMEITGAGGRSLKEAWARGAHAHLGISVPGFPSLYVVYGPNTNTSGGSIITYEEAQAAYVRQAMLNIYRDSYRKRRTWFGVRPLVAERTAYGPPYAVAADKVDVHNALAHLSPRERACVVLRHYEYLTVPDVAERLGLSEGAVKRYLSDGTRALRGLLGDAVHVPDEPETETVPVAARTGRSHR